MPGRIDIVLPGLFDLPLDELDPALIERSLPGLNRLLRFATPLPNTAFSIDAMLQRVLELGADGESLPLAQACAIDASANDRRLLLLQAVHLRADLDPVDDGLFILRHRVYVVTDLFSAVMASLGGDDEEAVDAEPVSVISYRLDAPRLVRQ